MNKFFRIIFGLFIISVFNACGGEDTNLSSDTQIDAEPASVNHQAITFPDLSSSNAPMPNMPDLEQK
jgi:hypothetical protein